MVALLFSTGVPRIRVQYHPSEDHDYASQTRVVRLISRFRFVVNFGIGILAMTVSLLFPCQAASREAIFPAGRRRERVLKPLIATGFTALTARFWTGNQIFSRVSPAEGKNW
jgi:hypothetical protein